MFVLPLSFNLQLRLNIYFSYYPIYFLFTNIYCISIFRLVFYQQRKASKIRFCLQGNLQLQLVLVSLSVIEQSKSYFLSSTNNKVIINVKTPIGSLAAIIETYIQISYYNIYIFPLFFFYSFIYSLTHSLLIFFYKMYQTTFHQIIEYLFNLYKSLQQTTQHIFKGIYDCFLTFFIYIPKQPIAVENKKSF
ncbi:transmembrane protein, putative (macronuclear) [Tetrahymena thermophila SB210]|uniref:Transmembrane protein, putative n=1 Tax=Tetrahymena thermophila (strain SB210) TaxID=312017 RepID=W7XA83_TETTS|nr:transmembrane protein, putative [Tetrahymena thermophila SB210]EWS76285.1 transmembrane protein, putative [Tetrahymena thermophila SB210]|eukprot:XP_012651069.1 transmembrane protein, putative [Tetrahymena thermophila SB210]